MPYTTIVFERRNHIGHLLLNRPQQGNALSHTMHHEIAALCEQIYDDDELYVLGVSGAGDHFCRGAVLSGVPSLSRGQSKGVVLSVVPSQSKGAGLRLRW